MSTTSDSVAEPSQSQRRTGTPTGIRTFGPLGTLLGTALQSVCQAERGVAEALDLGRDDSYWRAEFRRRPYASESTDYDRWRPAYLYGWEARRLTWGCSWQDTEAQLEEAWSGIEPNLDMDWQQARPAVRDAWDRFEERTNAWLDEEERAHRDRLRKSQKVGQRKSVPAFRFGMLSRVQRPDTQWDEIETALANAWNELEEGAEAAWDSIRDFVREGWERLGDRLAGEDPSPGHAST